MSNDFDPKNFLQNFLETLSSTYSAQIKILCSQEAMKAFRAEYKPVSRGRHLMTEAYDSYTLGQIDVARTGQLDKARTQLEAGIALLDSGTVHPDESEWPIDGPEVGRAHACMWTAIAKVLTHKQSPQAFDADATNADSWFAIATLIFIGHQEPKMAARSLQEWAESRRMLSDFETAEILRLGAICLFGAIGESERLAVAAARSGQIGPVDVPSSFFLGRPPYESELRVLTTVLGARNSEAFYNALG